MTVAEVSSRKRTARFAGFLYLVMGLAGASILYLIVLISFKVFL